MITRTLRSAFLLPAALLVAVAPMIHAEEGMWTFNNLPVKQLAAKNYFHSTQGRHGWSICACRACGSLGGYDRRVA
jgi:hypothetical protein